MIHFLYALAHLVGHIDHFACKSPLAGKMVKDSPDLFVISRVDCSPLCFTLFAISSRTLSSFTEACSPLCFALLAISSRTLSSFTEACSPLCFTLFAISSRTLSSFTEALHTPASQCKNRSTISAKSYQLIFHHH